MPSALQALTLWILEVSIIYCHLVAKSQNYMLRLKALPLKTLEVKAPPFLHLRGGLSMIQMRRNIYSRN